jgi:hypothetical protein
MGGRDRARPSARTRQHQQRLKRATGVALIEGQILIRRPVEVLFDFVADERNEPRYNRDDERG